MGAYLKTSITFITLVTQGVAMLTDWLCTSSCMNGDMYVGHIGDTIGTRINDFLCNC